MQTPLYQEDLREKQVVAVWVGDIENEGALYEYLGTPFESDFGFLLDYDDLPEFARLYSEPRLHAHYNRPFLKSDVRQLLIRLPWSREWIDEAERRCRDNGAGQVHTVVAFPNLRYPEERCRNPQAPLQFIGNFRWTGGLDAWTRLQDKRLVLPPFPKLIRHDFGDGSSFNWKTIVHLDGWKGFADDASLSSDGWKPARGCLPDGDFELEIDPTSPDKESRPVPEQAEAYQRLISRQSWLRDTILKIIFHIYPQWRENYCGAGLPSKEMPEVKSPGELMNLIQPSGLGILSTVSDGISDIHIHFRCRWDEEHGFSVLVRRGNDVEIES